MAAARKPGEAKEAPKNGIAPKTPLGIISLFVTLLEAFLAYPVSQLVGTERLILVIFLVTFPFFVAAGFFVVLYYKPTHLYAPSDIPPELRGRYQQEQEQTVSVLSKLAKRIDRIETQLRAEETARATDQVPVVNSETAILRRAPPSRVREVRG